MNVHWTDNAIRHLTAIHDYIAANSPVYAKAMIDKLTRRSEQLAAFPNSGRRVPEHEAQDIREVIERPYRNHLPHLARSHRCCGCCAFRSNIAGRIIIKHLR